MSGFSNRFCTCNAAEGIDRKENGSRYWRREEVGKKDQLNLA